MHAPATTHRPADVARHYDEVDPFYRALWGDHLHHGLWETGDETPEEAVRALVDRVAERAGLKAPPESPGPQLELPLPGLPGRRVVDIGCGYGATAERLADRLAARVTGITLSPAQHAFATARAGGREDPAFILGDWLANDLPDGAFDAAIAIESTEHMSDKPRVFAEVGRVLRPGGRLAVCAWLADPLASPRQVRHLLRPICEEGRLASLDTADDYIRWIGGAGFEDVAVEDLSTRVARTWTICARRMLRALGRPATWRYLLDRRNTERGFAVAVLRMVVAFRVGALRYGLFTARKGEGNGGGFSC